MKYLNPFNYKHIAGDNDDKSFEPDHEQKHVSFDWMSSTPTDTRLQLIKFNSQFEGLTPADKRPILKRFNSLPDDPNQAKQRYDLS